MELERIVPFHGIGQPLLPDDLEEHQIVLGRWFRHDYYPALAPIASYLPDWKWTSLSIVTCEEVQLGSSVFGTATIKERRTRPQSTTLRKRFIRGIWRTACFNITVLSSAWAYASWDEGALQISLIFVVGEMKLGVRGVRYPGNQYLVQHTPRTNVVSSCGTSSIAEAVALQKSSSSGS